MLGSSGRRSAAKSLPAENSSSKLPSCHAATSRPGQQPVPASAAATAASHPGCPAAAASAGPNWCAASACTAADSGAAAGVRLPVAGPGSAVASTVGVAPPFMPFCWGCCASSRPGCGRLVCASAPDSSAPHSASPLPSCSVAGLAEPPGRCNSCAGPCKLSLPQDVGLPPVPGCGGTAAVQATRSPWPPAACGAAPPAAAVLISTAGR